MKTIYLLLLLLNIGCVQSKQETTMQQFKRVTTIDETKEKSGYFIQINNQNCRYEIRVNDFLTSKYVDPFPAYSVRQILNHEILKSGKQTLSIRVTPFKGTKLSKNADLSIRLMRYPNMLDKKNEFGGSTTIMEWEMPQIKEELPYVQFDTIFNADVPYEIKDFNYAMDLNDIDKEALVEEVVMEFKKMHKMLVNDYGSFNLINKQGYERLRFFMYCTEEYTKKLIQENFQDFEKDGDKFEPIENYVLQLYGNGKVATLERIKDGGRIIWAKNPKTGNERLSLPLFIYKDIRDKQWRIW